jgi:hypothetical protein
MPTSECGEGGEGFDEGVLMVLGVQGRPDVAGYVELL